MDAPAPGDRAYSLLLLNGGTGTRVGSPQPKQLLKLRGIPILVYSLVVAERLPQIAQVVLNHPPGWRGDVEEVLEAYAISTPVTLVEAAATRHASVAAMIGAAVHEHVVLHESARPLADRRDFARLLACAQDNVALMAPIPFTVAPVDPATGAVTGSLDRSRLRNVQLPQKFRRADLAAAHARARELGREYTEDATMLADLGFPVHFIDGSDRNLKVTTATDMRIAAALLSDEGALDG